MKFKNIQEFRSALNGLMASGPKKSRKNHHRSGFGTSIPDRETQYDQVEGPFASMSPIPVNRRNPAKARANMAFRFTDGSGRVHEADTIEEYQKLMATFGAGRAPEPRVSGPRTVSLRQELPRLPAQRAPKARAKRAFHLDPTKVGAPVSPSQGAIIQAALGGTASFCPSGVVGTGKLGQVTGADALNALGMTYGAASDIISGLKSRGLNGRNPDQIAQARQFVAGATKIAFKNPRRNPRSRNPNVVDGCWGNVARPNQAVPRGMNPVMLIGEDGEEWARYAQDRAGVAHRNPRKAKKNGRR